MGKKEAFSVFETENAGEGKSMSASQNKDTTWQQMLNESPRPWHEGPRWREGLTNDSRSSHEERREEQILSLVSLFNCRGASSDSFWEWPGLGECNVVEWREIGVPLKPGYKPSDCVASVLKCAVLLVRAKVSLQVGVLVLTGTVENGLRRSSVELVARNPSNDVLSSALGPGTLSLDDLVSVQGHVVSLLCAFGRAATAQREEVSAHKKKDSLHTQEVIREGD